MEPYGEHREAEGWLTVYCPDVRTLTETEIAALPLEKRRAAEAGGESGVWLRVLCPRESCVTGEDTISLPVRGVPLKEAKGFWLKLFCPEDSCVVDAPSDLP